MHRLAKSPCWGKSAVKHAGTRWIISTTFNLFLADADVHNSSSVVRPGYFHLKRSLTAGCDGTADPFISFNSKCSHLLLHPNSAAYSLPPCYHLPCLPVRRLCVCARCDLCHVYFFHAVRDAEILAFSYLKVLCVSVQIIY